jgi:hypothetical protein
VHSYTRFCSQASDPVLSGVVSQQTGTGSNKFGPKKKTGAHDQIIGIGVFLQRDRKKRRHCQQEQDVHFYCSTPKYRTLYGFPHAEIKAQ